jgi:predicted hotdog family 3-hydroxylacyl-ACP dehydratase|tara:strand:- start:2551 stop:3000 length:450 start_codon:yes stop_codon:yes gene_type:complete
MVEYELNDFVKHSGSMLLIDNFLSYDNQGIVVDVTITEKSLFFKNGYVPAWIGLEYAAQAVAAWAGLQAKRKKHKTKIGLLISCHRYECTRSNFVLGEKLTITTKEEFRDRKMGSYYCVIKDKNQIEIVTVTINAFLPDNFKNIFEIGL